MTLIAATKACLRKFIQFSGRASRSEYWYFVLFCMLVSLLLVIFNSLLNGPTVFTERAVVIEADGTRTFKETVRKQYTGGPLGMVFSIAMVLPMLAASWRRLHDVGRRGLWVLAPPAILVGYVCFSVLNTMTIREVLEAFATTGNIEVNDPPGVLPMFLLVAASFVTLSVWLCRKSEPRTNKYGPNPHEVSP